MREHKDKFCKILRKLEHIWRPVPENQVVDTLLRSLPSYYYAFVACYELMGVEKTVKEIFKMLLSDELDIYVHHQMAASTLQDQWLVHKRYKSYTQVIDINLDSNIFWYFILKFFMMHDRSMKRKRGKRFRKN